MANNWVNPGEKNRKQNVKLMEGSIVVDKNKLRSCRKVEVKV
jgi:hypothetical protein